MINFIVRYKFQLLLFFIVGLLFVLNYKTGAYLSGWDNLQTELNPGLAVKRALFSVWEEYQSFGLTAGMAHAADLIRATFLWIISFFLPNNMIRYFYHFFMLLLGGIGMMRLLNNNDSGRATLARMTNETISFLGALFYMLNLGTLQMFYLPFEAFSTFFAFLPWGIWIFLRLLRRSAPRKDILIFFFINLLGTPSFYTQALFAVYVLILGCIGLGKLISMRILNDSGRAQLTRMTFLFILIFLINSFWILPQIYFLRTNGNWITKSKSNQIATERTFRQNLEKGKLDNFLHLEGFYYDSLGIKNQPLFWPWKNHFSGWLKILPNLFAFLMILGLYESLRKKNFSYLFVFLICSIALLSATPPFSWLNYLLRTNSFINQIFRSPFTKFIIPYSLVFSYFVAQGINKISKTPYNTLTRLFLVSCFLLIVFYSLPAFRGNFISPEMKVKIPNEYLKLISFFKNKDKNNRIALLPDYTFWGWFFHKWGYNGSGFLWYGIEQPIVSRTFDVWSPASESYFWEQKLAMEAEDLVKLESIYEKYNIDYLLLDYSLIPVVSNYKSLQYDRIENLLTKSQKISPVFKNKYFTLFKFSHSHKINRFLSLSSELPNIGPGTKLLTDDKAFLEATNYKTDNNNYFDIYYPFLDLVTQTRSSDKNWEIVENADTITINTEIVLNQNNKNLFLQPDYNASILIENKLEEMKLNLTSSLTDNNLGIDFTKKLIKSFDVSNLDYSDEVAFSLPDLPQKYSYLVKVRTRNISGAPFYFYILDETKKQAALEDNLLSEIEYFILPAKFQYGLGYSFIFQKPKYAHSEAKNIIEELNIYLFPYDNLKTMKLFGSQSAIKTIFSENYTVNKSNYFTYKINLDQADSTQNLILYQSFDPGWTAFRNGKILDHFSVNNWANGWRISRSQLKTVENSLNQNVVVIFWPQYLEFIGFALLIFSFLYILKLRNSNKKQQQ